MVVSFCCVPPVLSPVGEGNGDKVWFHHGSVFQRTNFQEENVTVNEFSVHLQEEIDNPSNSPVLEPLLNAQNDKNSGVILKDGSFKRDSVSLSVKTETETEGESESVAPVFGSVSGAAIAANFRKTDESSRSSFSHTLSFSAHVLLPTGECDSFQVSNPYNGNPNWSSDPSTSKISPVSSSSTKTHDEGGGGGEEEERETSKIKRRSNELRKFPESSGRPLPSHNMPLLRWPSGEGIGKHLTEKWFWKSKRRFVSGEGADYGAICRKPEETFSKSLPVTDFLSQGIHRRPNLGYIWGLQRTALPIGASGQLLERQYAITIAGEDRSQFVVSEHGFLYLAIFDGFGGDDASEFLNKHLYTAVCEELKYELVKEKVTGRVEQAEGEKGGITGGRQETEEWQTEIYEQETGASLELNELDIGSSNGNYGDKNTVRLKPIDKVSEDSSEENGLTSENEGSYRHKRILKSLKRAVANTEERFFDYVEKCREQIPELLLVGSCVLVVVVFGDDVYTLSLGDSFAVIGSSSDESGQSFNDSFSFPVTEMEITENADTVVPSPTSGSELNRLKMLEVPDYSASGSGRQLNTPRSLSSSRRRLETDLESLLKQEGLLQDQCTFLSMEREKLPPSWEELLPLHLLATSAKLLTVEHNTSSPEEVKRVMEQHSDDRKPISDGRVKGKVKVTRCFGAGFMKKRELNESLLGYFRVKYVGDAPYLSSEPDLRHHRLCPEDTCLIVSSDGLYQHLDPEEAVALVDLSVEKESRKESVKDPARVLMEEAMKRGASAAGIPYQELLSMPVGERRLVHDDLSVIVLRFK